MNALAGLYYTIHNLIFVPLRHLDGVPLLGPRVIAVASLQANQALALDTLLVQGKQCADRPAKLNVIRISLPACAAQR